MKKVLYGLKKQRMANKDSGPLAEDSLRMLKTNYSNQPEDSLLFPSKKDPEKAPRYTESLGKCFKKSEYKRLCSSHA